MDEFRVGLGNPVETNLEPIRTFGVLNPDNSVRHSYADVNTAVRVAASLNGGADVQTTLPMFNGGNPFR